MPRRSPWAAQPKAKQRQIRREMTRIPLGKDEPLIRFLFKGSGSLSREEKTKIIKQNAARLAQLTSKKTGKNRTLWEQIFRTGATNATGAEINNMIAWMIKQRAQTEGKKMAQLLASQIEKYFQARQIPIKGKSDQAVFNHTINEYVSSHPQGYVDLTEPLDLRRLERSYIETRKQERNKAINWAALVNGHIRIVQRIYRLTPNQQKYLKKWFEKHKAKILDQLDAITAKYYPESSAKSKKQARTNEELHKELTEFLTFWATEGVNVAEQQFFPQTKHAAPNKQTTAPASKLGTRIQRKAEYLAKVNEEEAGRQNRQMELATREQATRISGGRFNQTEFILSQLARQNPAGAQFFNGLVTRRRLSAQTLGQLYVSGTLTQRIFQHAIERTPFVSEFGEQEIESLGRGLAAIGAHGRQIQIAWRYFRSPAGRKIYEFLEKNDLLETHHTGGDVVYLRRSL